MKKILIIVAFLALFLLIPPFFIGDKVETEFRAQIEQINQHPAYELIVTDYTKGWFNSSASLKMTMTEMPNDKPGSEPFSLVVEQNIQHGPVLWTARSIGLGLMDSTMSFEMPESLIAEFDSVENLNQDTLTLSSRMAFDTSIRADFALNAFLLRKDSTDINVLDAKGELLLTPKGFVKSESVWQGLTVTEPTGQSLVLGVTKTNSKQQLVSGKIFMPDAIFAGEFYAKIKNVDITSPAKTDDVEMTNLKLSAKTEVHEDAASIYMVANVDTIKAVDQEFKNFTYDLSLENLDTHFLAEVNKAVLEAQAGGNADPMASAAKLQGLLPKLVERGPLLKLNQLGMSTKDGEINNQIEISIDQSIYDVDNPMTMMLAIDAKATGHGPEIFFANVGLKEDVDMLIQQNMLVRDQQNLKFDFTFKQGQALLNGTPMPMF